MRNFKIRRTKPIFISKAAFVNVTLLAGVAIFVALAVLTGNLVGSNILPDTDVELNPTLDNNKIVISQPTPTPDMPINTPPASVNTNSSIIKIDSRDYYFVQFGMFSNSDNARVCADSIASMGGAGYIMQSDGKYYVFAMCYSNGNDAQTVVSNLKSQGYSALLKCFSHSGMTLNISGSKEGISKIETAFKGIVSVCDELEALIYKFDKKEIDRTELKNQLRNLLGNIDTYSNAFSTYSQQNEIFAEAEMLCSNTYENITSILKSENDIELKASLKNIYITSVFDLIQYLDNAVVG